ncbi:MAG: ATP-binding cassette domain-containing protein [Mariprofundaceae bacterium]|nr:ATP-binding cassette domain-containing protein [Mariprofundaceae bacterium]
MLYFDKLSLRRGKRLLFADATFTINASDKMGITGANGSGKSSLFSLILNRIEEDRGQLRRHKNIAIAHVAQETPAVDTSALDYVMQGDIELSTLQQQLELAEQQQDGTKLTKLHERMQQIDAYAAPSRAARLLNGLGFTASQEKQAVQSFSGGWRMRLNLAQALMCRSDLLLLDEPTNHLDLEAVIWLERWLNHYTGALLLISHDRDFLDRCVQHIAHLEQQQVNLYTGNYSAFEIRRAEQLSQKQSAYEKQQQQKAHMNSYIDRFRAKASKARQAQSRIKALERMQDLAPAHVDSPFDFAFQHPGVVPNPLLRLNKASASYGETCILEKISMSLLPGDRIGLLGFNGAGKSTLIKMLADKLIPSQGQREEAQGLRIGYFAQHQLEQLMPTCSPLQHLQRLNDKASEKELRSFLGGFDFNGDMAVEAVAPFSGGEKARLVLAMLVYQQPNLLLLDEPTNHLDLDMRHALTMALQSFEGAMVLVSHDRHLLRTVCDSLLLVHASKVETFNHDLDSYALWLSEQSKQQNSDQSTAEKTSSNKDERDKSKQQRKQSQPLRNKIKKLEQSLESMQQRQAELDKIMAQENFYHDDNKEQIQCLSSEYSNIEQQLEQTEEDWLHACEALESL